MHGPPLRALFPLPLLRPVLYRDPCLEARQTKTIRTELLTHPAPPSPPSQSSPPPPPAQTAFGIPSPTPAPTLALAPPFSLGPDPPLTPASPSPADEEIGGLFADGSGSSPANAALRPDRPIPPTNMGCGSTATRNCMDHAILYILLTGLRLASVSRCRQRRNTPPNLLTICTAHHGHSSPPLLLVVYNFNDTVDYAERVSTSPSIE